MTTEELKKQLEKFRPHDLVSISVVSGKNIPIDFVDQDQYGPVLIAVGQYKPNKPMPSNEN
jgi:hypothetical protein